MRTLLIAILLSLAPLTASATISERDLLEPGDGLLTYDDVNQREWLDLPFSQKSLAEIESDMQAGGTLSDFQFATLAEVETLRDAVDTTRCDQPDYNSLIDHLGYIVRATGGIYGETQFTLGQVIVGENDTLPLFDGTNMVIWSIGSGNPIPSAPCRSPHAQPAGGIGMTNSSNYVPGTFSPLDGWIEPFLAESETGPFWLYRAAIPEPSTSTLLGTTTLLAAAVRSRRRSF